MGNRDALVGFADMALVDLARGGHEEAFSELWKRHSRAVVAASRAFTSFDPDDVTQDTFLRILQQIRNGNGPQTAFRAYAIMTARSVAMNMARRRSSTEITGVSEDTFESASEPLADTAEAVLESRFTSEVFRSLPQRWQEVLWYRDVEKLPVREFSVFLGMGENATSALLKRAHEGFKQAWIAASLTPRTDLSPDCRWLIEKLPQYVRGRSTAHVRRRLERHLETCAHCAITFEEAERLQDKLLVVLLPALLGVSGAAGYRTWVDSGANQAFAGPMAGAHASAGIHSAALAKAALVPVALVSSGLVAIALVGGSFSPRIPDSAPPPQSSSAAEKLRSTTKDGSGSRASVDSTDSYSEAPRASGDPEGFAENPPGREPPTASPAPDDGSDADRPNDQTENPPRVEPTPDPPRTTGPETTVMRTSTLSAVPADGQETGVYPRLLGTGRAGAVVHLEAWNESGRSVTAEIEVSPDGTWQYTPSDILGTLTIRAFQSYRVNGDVHVEKSIRIGVFSVGDGLEMAVTASGPNQSTARITGFGEASRNQVVSVSSSVRGTLVSKQGMTAPGEVVIVLQHVPASLGTLTFWQGDTSQGPVRTWRWRPDVPLNPSDSGSDQRAEEGLASNAQHAASPAP